jgi:trehalose-6-phosphate synthase
VRIAHARSPIYLQLERSNRLPVTISKDVEGKYHFKMSSGGLVSALSGAKKQMNFTWIGWPGALRCPVDLRADPRR